MLYDIIKIGDDMKKLEVKKYILVITYAVVFTFLLFNIKEVLSLIGKGISVLTPLWIGILLAITLNVPMRLIENKFFKKTNKRIRIMSLIVSILFIALILLILFAWVIPDFIESATYLVGQLPNLLSSLNDVLINLFKNTSLAEYLQDFSGTSELMTIVTDMFKDLINNFSGILSNLAALLVNIVTGIIIAIYFLFEKEHIIGMFKKMFTKLLDSDTYNKCHKIVALSIKTLNNFITYQCLECLIIGVLMFIAFSIFRFPYALTIAFLTAITAIVPIFGATVAAVIGAILIGTASIKQAIVFVIVFMVVQQIEGNVIYPKVVGKKVGLPPIITIVAVIVGGKLGGVFGMLISVPLTSILYTLFWSAIEGDKIPKIKIPKIKKNKKLETKVAE